MMISGRHTQGTVPIGTDSREVYMGGNPREVHMKIFTVNLCFMNHEKDRTPQTTFPLFASFLRFIKNQSGVTAGNVAHCKAQRAICDLCMFLPLCG